MATKYFFEKKATGGLYLWSDDDGGGGANSNWSSTASPTYTATTKPANTDTVVITAATTCTYDENMTGGSWVNGVTLTVNGTLKACETAAAYTLKTSADITLTGTLQAGTSAAVPYPATCTFTIDFNNGSNSIVMNTTTSRLYLYCQEPTIRYMALSAQEAAGQTVLSVDDDVTGDIWKAGDTICICDFIPVGGLTRDNEEKIIAPAGITTNTITVTVALAAQKEIGAKVALITRNIRLINSTDYFSKSGTNSYVAAEVYGGSAGVFSVLSNSTVGGAILLSSGVAAHIFDGCTALIFSGVAAQAGSTGGSSGANNVTDFSATSTSLMCGTYYGAVNSYNCSFAGEIASVIKGVNGGKSLSYIGVIKGASFAVEFCGPVWFTGTTSNVTRSFSQCFDIRLGNAQLGNSIGGVTSTYDFWACGSAVAYNTLYGATTTFYNYNSSLYRARWNYAESFDHDQSVNAYAAWTLGGIVTSQTASPPAGYTIWYEHACEDTDPEYPCFRQYETTVMPGQSIEVRGVLRIADGEDFSGVGELPPRLQILDKFADPLVDSTQVPLDEDIITSYDGSNTDWQEVDVIWANAGDSPRQVIVRMLAYSHTSGNTDIDETWAVATYQDEINQILQRVKRISLPSEF